jgi:hypothetical protein
MDVQKTQHKRADKDDHQADKRKVLDQPEGFYFVGFCQGHWFVGNGAVEVSESSRLFVMKRL